MPVPRYLQSEWSWAQFRVPDGGRCIVGFGSQPNTLAIVSNSGSFYRVRFDPTSGGACSQESFCRFMSLGSGAGTAS